jgi:hypothetical protein
MPAHTQDGVGWTGQLAYELGHGPEGVALLAHRHRRTCWLVLIAFLLMSWAG